MSPSVSTPNTQTHNSVLKMWHACMGTSLAIAAFVFLKVFSDDMSSAAIRILALCTVSYLLVFFRLYVGDTQYLNLYDAVIAKLEPAPADGLKSAFSIIILFVEACTFWVLASALDDGKTFFYVFLFLLFSNVFWLAFQGLRSVELLDTIAAAQQAEPRPNGISTGRYPKIQTNFL